jgi:orotate phosphoribosyltransferase-like protein
MDHVRGEPRIAPQMARAARRERVAELLLKGLTYRQIAAELGVSDGTVCKDAKILSDGWQRQATAAIGEHIGRQDARLEALNAAIWDVAMTGDPQSVDTCLKIMKRKAQLLGLDKAGKADLTLYLHEDQELEAKLEWMASNIEAGREIADGLPASEGDASD